MFDNSNPYSLRSEVTEGITHYYVSFVDGEGVHRETEVSRPVYLEFLRFVKVERNLRRWDERHIEQSELSDEALLCRALCPQKSVEDTAFIDLANAQLRLATQSLPETQRRRFVLYHEFGLTYDQIAEIEGRDYSSVYESVQVAVAKVKEILKFFES